ncbi:MAG TPA: prepilin-type N-terminal cleavage/methylation domain-containing protein [Planctomycetota bacterium]|nr:prepilin-type N-terminal cleavage/methylation domain-containing protein [Planctomycetota bacterium]
MKPLQFRRKSSGFTLIELLVVMGIIVLMVTIALVSVASMLRSSRMSRAVGLIVAAADEARTAAITIRRSTKVDLTRIDEEGRFNRLTVVGPFFNENFESYQVYDPKLPLPANGPASGNWVTTASTAPYVEADGTRCLSMVTAGAKTYYWNVGGRVDSVSQGDFELNVQARVKILPAAGVSKRTLSVLAAIKDSGSAVSAAYSMDLSITPAAAATAPGRNTVSEVTLNKNGGQMSTPIPGGSGTATGVVTVDQGAPAPTTALVAGVWYRVSLSVKRISDPDTSKPAKAIVAGKVWADGQLEPWAWTVGPMLDTSPLNNGTGGFAVENCNGRVDDVLFDVRPIRNIPEGLRVDAMAVTSINADPTQPGSWTIAKPDSNFNFPVMFRPDGTSAERYLIRITDVTTGDSRYVNIDQNSGRARLEHSLKDAIK